MSQTDLTALKKAVKLVADAVSDSIKAAADTSGAAKLIEFQNLVPDILNLIQDIGSVPAEASHLAPEDFATLIAELAADLVLPVGKTEELVKTSLKLLSDIAVVVLPDVAAVIAAAKS